MKKNPQKGKTYKFKGVDLRTCRFKRREELAKDFGSARSIFGPLPHGKYVGQTIDRNKVIVVNNKDNDDESYFYYEGEEWRCYDVRFLCLKTEMKEFQEEISKLIKDGDLLSKINVKKEIPADIKKLLFKYHSHAEILNNIDPEQIVYKEKDVIEIINYILNKK